MTSRSSWLLILALVLVPRAALAQDGDALDPLRERFKNGMESYRAGRFADAILVWDAIYRELGPAKGYRLSYNLGRAYDGFGNPTRAAEHYEIFLAEVVARRDRNETIEENVVEQETEARQRLGDLAVKNGRIRVLAGTRTHIAQLDRESPRVGAFVVYVTPGRHTVVLDADKSFEVDIAAGEIREIDPPEKVAPPVVFERPRRYETHTEHPFSPTYLWVAGAVTVATVVIPIATYANALSIKSDYDSPSTPRDRKTQLASDYDGAKSTAYATIAIPSVLAAATVALSAWYLVGTKDVRVEVGLARVGLQGTF